MSKVRLRQIRQPAVHEIKDFLSDVKREGYLIFDGRPEDKLVVKGGYEYRFTESACRAIIFTDTSLLEARLIIYPGLLRAFGFEFLDIYPDAITDFLLTTYKNHDGTKYWLNPDSGYLITCWHDIVSVQLLTKDNERVTPEDFVAVMDGRSYEQLGYKDPDKTYIIID